MQKTLAAIAWLLYYSSLVGTAAWTLGHTAGTGEMSTRTAVDCFELQRIRKCLYIAVPLGRILMPQN